MRLHIEKDCIAIVPETPQDEAYIEDRLNLKEIGDYITFVRCSYKGGRGADFCVGGPSHESEEDEEDKPEVEKPSLNIDFLFPGRPTLKKEALKYFEQRTHHSEALETEKDKPDSTCLHGGGENPFVVHLCPECSNKKGTFPINEVTVKKFSPLMDKPFYGLHP